MLQNPCKTLGFKKNMVYKIPPGGGGKPYPASGLSIFICSSTLVQPSKLACYILHLFSSYVLNLFSIQQVRFNNNIGFNDVIENIVGP